MTRAAIYVRVSSEEQREGHSLGEQQRLCREFCARRGYSVIAEYTEVESAKNVTDRPEFQRMIADARAGRFSVIVCHKLDRFSRDVVDGLLTLKDLMRYGVSFVSSSEDFDFTTPVGEVVLTLLLAFARWYRRNLIGETTKGKQGRARKGLSNATTPPFGYRRVDGRDVPGEDAPLVREMFERYATGEYTDLQIAEWLNSLGRTTTGNWGARPFSKDTVREMLQNPFYAGWVVYRGLVDRENDRRERLRRGRRDLTLIPGQHEALITQELFDRCQMVRKARGRRYAGRGPAQGRIYLLSRLARCAHCGGPLRATRYGPQGTGYRCAARERGQPCEARHTHVPQDALVGDLTGIMAQLRLPEDIRAQAIELLTADDPATAAARKRERLEGELRRLNRMYQAGTVTDDYFDAEAARIRAELAGLETPGQTFDARAAVEAIDDMARLWDSATAQERADILQSVFERVYVDLDARRIVSFTPKSEYRPMFGAVFANDGSDGIRTRGLGLDRATC